MSEDRGPKRRKMGVQKSQKKRVNEHEQALAEEMGGVRQPNSGALDHRKGDISLKNFLLESKETDTQQLVLYAKDITKISKEASQERKIPALVLTLWKMPYTVSKEWVAVPKEVFIEMMERVDEQGEIL
jgi:hypothetical protein